MRLNALASSTVAGSEVDDAIDILAPDNLHTAGCPAIVNEPGVGFVMLNPTPIAPTHPARVTRNTGHFVPRSVRFSSLALDVDVTDFDDADLMASKDGNDITY